MILKSQVSVWAMPKLGYVSIGMIAGYGYFMARLWAYGQYLSMAMASTVSSVSDSEYLINSSVCIATDSIGRFDKYLFSVKTD
nr:hypothetical protein BgiMline_007157 [Biomphalaria glabrata]